MNALLVRHTRLAGVEGVCYGRADAVLAETFSEEAAALRAVLPWTPRAVWTSPARRCAALAEVLAGGVPVRVDERLQELYFGKWEGRRWDTFHGPESEAWALDPWTVRPPGGETGLEMWARVAAVRSEATARTLVVTHAGVIRLWLAQTAGEAPGAAVFNREVGYGRVWPVEAVR